ncbi:MAG: hypothetical protein WDO74_21675 [Pseudomonadota bacterium]
MTPEGEPAPAGIKVAGEGVSYLGESNSWTDADGRFSVRVMASTDARKATARLYAEGTGRYAELPAASTPTQLASTGKCVDVGNIELAFPLASMVLTWGKQPSDLDSHFTGPIAVDGTKRFHVSFSDRNVGNAFLDTDDTSAFGPEVTSLLKAVPGTYLYSVHNFSGEVSGKIAESAAKVIAIFPAEELSLDVGDAVVPEDFEARRSVWRVFKFDISEDGVISAIEPINEIVPESEDAFEP